MATHSQNNNHSELQIDKVLSSQPELGPNVPEGGYGWLILAASAFFQGLIPSLSVGFGVFVLFWRLENNAPLEPTLWDSKVVYTSLVFTAIWTVADPWSRLLSTTSTWPRLVATAGTCLTCAGLLVMWIAIKGGNSTALFLLAGLLAGVGASIVLSQTDILISQYFHLKLEPVKIVLNAASALGFIIAPVALGHNIVKIGILQVITWYQAIILQGILISIAFKKPKYLKRQKSKYKLVRGISDDEEDIFAKNTTELQNPRRTSNTNHNSNTRVEATIEISPAITTTSTYVSTENLSHIANGDSTENVNLEKTESQPKQAGTSDSNWEKFDDDSRTNHVQTLKTQTNLHKTFAEDFSNDLDRIDKFEDNYIEIPTPLFSETQINNNTSYSYEAPLEIEDPVVFMPITKATPDNSWKRDIEFLKQPTFYKSLLFIITTKFSIFTFWTLFPAYLYIRIDSLKIQHTTVLVGCIGIGSLVFTTLATWIKGNPNTRAIFLWIFCWMGAIGYLLLSDSQGETTLIFGAVDITLSITALQILGTPLMKISLRGETSRAHMILSALTGISFILFLIINMSYKNCFRFMALLQFLTGSLWFSNFFYKRIKRWMTTRG